jgi:hypothetical protein
MTLEQKRWPIFSALPHVFEQVAASIWKTIDRVDIFILFNG